jgi:plastocyanin
MSLITDSLRASAAGAVICCAVYAVGVAAPGEIRIGIDNFTFAPEIMTVPSGTKVVWTNADDTPHSIVETTGKFRSAALDTDDRFTLVFDKAGTFAYFCGLHPHMKGTIVVSP